MAELIQLSHSVIHAFLARLDDPKLTLAAFNIAFSFNLILNGFLLVSTQTCLSFITDRPSIWNLARFYGLVAIFPFTVIESVALTPLSNIIFGDLIGASSEVVRQARVASAIMGFYIAPVLIRNFANSLVMIHRQTIIITYATVIRLTSLGAFLVIYPYFLKGAAIGAAALFSCMTIEAVYMVIRARPFFKNLARDIGTRASFNDLWRFSWPLMITQSSENGVAFVINFFLGRLADPDLALAAFGVAFGLARLLLAPLRNLMQTTQALVNSREDLGVMFRFCFRLLLVYIGIIFTLFYTPLRGGILNSVMGLTLELSQYITPGVKLIFVLAIFWGFAAMFRGTLAGMRRTGVIVATAGISLLVLATVCSTTLFLPYINGTVVGVLAMSSAFVAETLILGWRIRSHVRSNTLIFIH